MSVKTGFDPEHAAQHEGAYAAGELYEPDMGGSQPMILFTYIAVLTAAFFLSLGGLYMYFKWEAQTELERKVRSIESPALEQLRTEEAARLQGIESAMDAVAKQYQGSAQAQGQQGAAPAGGAQQ